MPFIPNRSLKVGDKVKVVQTIETMAGIFTVGTKGTIIEEEDCEYTFMDDEGNRAIEVSISSFKKLEEGLC